MAGVSNNSSSFQNDKSSNNGSADDSTDVKPVSIFSNDYKK
jgi:hypothetical protein